MSPTQLAILLATNPALAKANPSLLPRAPSSSSSTKIISPDPSPALSEKTLAIKSPAGREKAEHIIFSDWLSRNDHPFLHAPTWRKVHDLPPGWPDFTLFRLPSSSCYCADSLFIELKVAGGRFSPDQSRFLSLFPSTKIAYSALDAIKIARNFFALL